MFGFIMLTDINFGTVYINVDGLSSFHKLENGNTRVFTTSIAYEVKEPLKEIMEEINRCLPL